VRKEQLFLVVCAVVGAALVWSSTGRYSEVGAASLTFSPTASVKIVNGAQPDPVKGLSPDPLKGRALSAMVRVEQRPPSPTLPGPLPPPIRWVRPITTPGATIENDKNSRAPMVVVKPPEEDPNAAAAPQPKDEPVDQGPAKPKWTKEHQARIVRTGGEETYVRLEPTGAFRGQPDWVILEKWPNVTFRIHSYNVGNKDQPWTEMGVMDATPEMIQGISAVYLSKTLENEFYEERIKRHVGENNRDAIVSFAKWVFETLPSHVGIDPATGFDQKQPYGLEAVARAKGEFKKAQALQNDLDITKQLGACCRAAYDPEGELKAYLDYLHAGHASDIGALNMVGDEYMREGAYESAREHYQKAAATGDTESRLKLGLIAANEGKFDEAADALKPIVGVANFGGRAALALAKISLAQAKLDEAAQYLEQAKRDASGVELNNVVGALQYAQGKYDDAAKSFALAKTDDPRTISYWRSNRGMALAAQSTLPTLDEAKKEFNACLDKDPLNLVDPLFGLGDYYQRIGDAQHSSDYFETALARAPDNPWILLRLAMIKLRDGQPAAALTLGTHLLEVAPGCNDALWVVGRAAATLDAPDLEKAASHLARAVDKESDNHEFLNEYARALLASGRTDEAIKKLDAACNVNGGFARNDARMLALAAWARYIGKRPVTPDVLDALNRGLRATPDDATKEWLDATKKALIEWDRTRVWRDDFDRSASGNVGNNWREQENLGINIGIGEGSNVVFRTGQSGVRDAAKTRAGATILDREDDLGRFKEMRASFKASQGVETVFGMHLGPLAERPDPNGKRGRTAFEISFGCDRNGNMVLWTQLPKEASTTEHIVKDAAGANRQWPMDEAHTVRIVRTDETRGYFEVWLDDEKITYIGGTADKPTPMSRFEIGSLNAQAGRMFAFGFVVDADSGAQVDVSVDWVELTKVIR